jgi:hypothetical protein
MRRLVAWGAVAVVVLAARGAAQGTAAATALHDTTDLSYRNRLLGVFDVATGLPIEDADVIDVFSGVSAKTTRTGTVALGFLPDGGALIRIRKFGYEMRTMIVAISPADTVPITVALQRVVQLPAVVTYGTRPYISPLLRGFEDRRRRGVTGYFLSDAELRKDDGRLLVNVLRSRLPAVHIDQRGHSMFLMQSPRCLGGGPPDVYVDGMAWPHPLQQVRRPREGTQLGQSGNDSIKTGSRDTTVTTMTMQPIDIADFQVWDLAGVEYYPDDLTMPPQFHHTPGACGALLLWTRER